MIIIIIKIIINKIFHNLRVKIKKIKIIKWMIMMIMINNKKRKIII